MSNPLPKIVAVIGPTASGKTDLGAAIAQKFNGEIISVDAKQVYKRMNIGTAKELNLNISQHLIDIKEPGEKITVGEFQELAYQIIDKLLKEKKLPVLVGGSGLYAEAVTAGYTFGGPGRKEKQPRYRALKIGLEMEREVLKEKAAQRLQQRIDQGLPAEVASLLNEGVDPEWLWQCGIEYRYFSGYARGIFTLEEATAKTKQAINDFIKRQYTWWRRHSDVHWVKTKNEALELVKDWLA